MEAVQVFYGEGHGKSEAALGAAIYAASHGKSTIFIRFLEEKNEEEYDYFTRLEPELRMFRFEKSKEKYAALSTEEQRDEVINIRNGDRKSVV